MATVRGVVNFRVKPGRYADLFEALKAGKNLLERLGAHVVVNRVAVGVEVGNVVAVAQYADWAAYAKAVSDPEWQKFLEATENNPNPPWESLTTSIVEEVAL
jgi:hypothetical protein